ncbi:glycosyltransferase family 2 protein [Vibrio breoganii]|uniref:Glycosyltransferase family 2 protein n=1 Tax=Vibrio breoganii TaxID=553239 RepID=A0ABX1UAK8_9VIBR|nr:glycosyltransferase family 2 protein [Vibrio breoganii]NMO74821.1 glycosyltransferase family 2 protein [Vibrio breoganii]NMR71456.1 glycosyltransferase family 2 protein [Vibrio breoganii]PML84902.1 hypothetical protein BCT67_15615 [Vibrio breoganii]
MISISVIIPTCNRLDTIRAAVDSVVDQRLNDLEIIVVDDSTKDSTKELNALLKDYNNIKIVRNENHSPANARNYGVFQATKDYVTFLDDDDIYLRGRLNNIGKFIVENENKFSFFSSGRFKEYNDFEEIKTLNNQKFGVIKLTDNIYTNNIDIGFVMKRELFISLGGFSTDFPSLEDWDFIIRALKVGDGYKLSRLDYAVNSTTGRTRVSDKQVASRMLLAEKYRDDFGDKWYFKMFYEGLSFKKEMRLADFFKCLRVIGLVSSLKYYIKSVV